MTEISLWVKNGSSSGIPVDLRVLHVQFTYHNATDATLAQTVRKPWNPLRFLPTSMDPWLDINGAHVTWEKIPII